MPTIGTTTKPSSYWWSVETGIEQIAERLTAPGGIRILEAAIWLGGYNGNCRGRLCIWDADTFALLASSAELTVPNGGGAGGAVVLTQAALTVPPRLSNGSAFLVGFQRRQADGFTYNGGNTSGNHWEAEGGSALGPSDFGAGAGDPSEETRRIGAYVADYELIPGAKVYRSGSWVDAEGVQVYRSGSWTDAEAVQVYRGGSWIDAE
jgi:hypothetical protein